MIKKLKEKKGGSTLFEIVIALGLITFILFYPVVLFSYNQKASLLEDVLTIALQNVSVEGGLTKRGEDLIYDNLEAKGLLPANSSTEERRKVLIVCNADARENSDNLIYRDDEDPKIHLEIWYPADTEVSFINGLNRLIGAATTQYPTNNGQVNWYYRMQGYIYSEKIDY